MTRMTLLLVAPRRISRDSSPAIRLSKTATWFSLVTHLDSESAEEADETMTTHSENPELLERSTQ